MIKKGLAGFLVVLLLTLVASTSLAASSKKTEKPHGPKAGRTEGTGTGGPDGIMD